MLDFLSRLSTVALAKVGSGAGDLEIVGKLWLIFGGERDTMV